MPSNPAYLHLRDFIEEVGPDPARPSKGLALQLLVSLHIPEKEVQSDDVDIHDIPTLIRFFCEPGRSADLYQPDSFVYAWGSFLTATSQDRKFHILLHAHTVDRHPGNLTNTESYCNRCPEAAQPTVTFQGIVNNSGGQLNSGSTLLHYRLQVTVYDSSTKAEHTFPVTIYLKNGQRWTNFPSLSPQTQVFVGGRIFGTTKENQQLAVLADDIHFLQTMPRTVPPSPASTGKRKHPDRWARQSSPHTPSKAARLTDTALAQPSTQCSSTLQSPATQKNSAIPSVEADKETVVSWPPTDSEPDVSPASKQDSPAERRSQRSRNRISYADILSYE